MKLFSVLLAAALLASARPASTAGPGQRSPGKVPCRLVGTWVNELGSNATFAAANAEGVFAGFYQTAVTASNAPIRRSPLQGFLHQPNQRAQPTFGFTVRWSFTNSVTVFAGQCFVGAHGVETLKTTWLLRNEAPALADDWKATLVGQNVFHRVK